MCLTECRCTYAGKPLPAPGDLYYYKGNRVQVTYVNVLADAVFYEATHRSAGGRARLSWFLQHATDLAEKVARSSKPNPPLGVKPRNLHDEERANALDEAIVRYLNEDLPVPIEWVQEFNELRTRLNKEK